MNEVQVYTVHYIWDKYVYYSMFIIRICVQCCLDLHIM